MPVTRKQFTLGLLIAAVCAAVYAIGDHGQVAEKDPYVTPPPPSEGEGASPENVPVDGSVPSFWAKTSDFDTAPAEADRNSDAPSYAPPTIYPRFTKDAEAEPISAALPGGVEHAIQMELPEDAVEALEERSALSTNPGRANP